jgi:hypothetical protein
MLAVKGVPIILTGLVGVGVKTLSSLTLSVQTFSEVYAASYTQFAAWKLTPRLSDTETKNEWIHTSVPFILMEQPFVFTGKSSSWLGN